MPTAFKRLLPVCKYLIPGLAAWAYVYCYAQPNGNSVIWDKLLAVEKDTLLSVPQKLEQVYMLKKNFEDRKLQEDSVYARMLHKIGLYTYLTNNQLATNEAIAPTLAAVRINGSGRKNAAPSYRIISYTNLGVYYASLKMYGIAGVYYDSAVLLKQQYPIPENPVAHLVADKARMLLRSGDYAKAIEEFSNSILLAKEARDTGLWQSCLNQRAQSYLMQGSAEAGLKDVELAEAIVKPAEVDAETISGTMIKARLLAEKKEYLLALPLFQKAIKQRLETNDYNQISDDYTDFGNFYLNDLHDYKSAKSCYLNTLKYAGQTRDFERLAKGHNNLEQCSYRQQHYKEAEMHCIESLKNLDVNTVADILVNPPAVRLSSTGNKELILFVLGNKTELLLKQFSESGNRKYLSACLHTALLSDTLITQTRHEQTGEQSKLYWRVRTREFFTNAVEACWLANNPGLAFYFIEKSRAVLLNDKLNELGASAHLPNAEAAKEHELKIAVISEQLKISSMQSGEDGYEIQQGKISEAKGNLEHYLKSLEKNHPAYWQYKYADEVPELDALQKHLMKNKQSFIHYFINDTVAYILGITASGTKLIKLTKGQFNSSALLSFMRLCSDQQALNNDYRSFAVLSYSLYKLLFQPLGLPGSRVIVCPDNFLIPFEALCKDRAGSNFLIKDYTFSYVYSARYLMKGYTAYEAKGEFIGFAPVSFTAYNRVADLKQSAAALKQSSDYYNNATLFINSKATRNNFINAVSAYTVVNIFSHARADTTDNEPVLFMHDSTISLSELQLLHHTATKLAVLSACQTSVGKSAKGEGVLSLARGFAAAGIPAVAATLWEADEQSIYEITKKFNEYISKGMNKDEALQKAKLDFMQNNDKGKQLPYYWANMILAGNGEPIKLSGNNNYNLLITAIVLLTVLLAVLFVYLKKKGLKKA